ncbi:ATP-binding protein [Streptomyces tendae]
MDKRTFGRLLREARRRSLLTLENLAEASGVSVRAISDMERGRSLPRQTTLVELMDALELDEDQRRRLVQASTRRTERVLPRQLPPDLAAFRGREEALTRAHGFTSQVAGQGGHVVVAAVGGMAGVGKTTLAVHWAHQMADRFPDGQLYVNLRGFEDSGRPLDPGEALGGFLSALGVPSGAIPRGTEQRGALFREQAASRRLIVVLDNARDAEQVKPLLPASAGCLAIVTSRNQLSGLAAAEGASLIGLDVWPPAEALAALTARIGEERCRAEPEAAAELVELCGHLPLAVAVVGAQLSATPQTPLRLATRELRDSQQRLDALSIDDQQVDIRAVFSWSYRALTAEPARFFRHLAVHPEPAFTAQAAASLTGSEMATTRRHLRELTTASLLSRDADGRYVMHDLVRAYAAELLEQERDDRFGAETRLLDYLRHNAHAATQVLDTRPREELTESPAPGVVRVAIADRAEALDWFRQEEAAVAAGLRSMTDPRLLPHRVKLTHDWQSYLSVMGRWADQISIQRIGLEAALVLDDPVFIVQNSANLARALTVTEHVAATDEQVDEQIDLILGQLDRLDAVWRAYAERNVGWVRHRTGGYSEAVYHSRRALAIYRTLPEPDRVARELNALGWYLAQLGDYRQAIGCCEEALPILQANGNRRIEATTWDSIGYARQRLGDTEAAIVDYQRSLRLYGEVFDPYNQANVLNHLASAQLELGQGEQARASYEQAADLFRATGSPHAAEMKAKAEAAVLPRRENR